MSQPQERSPIVFDVLLNRLNCCPYPSVLKLRDVSRMARNRVDAALVSHIALIPPPVDPEVLSRRDMYESNMNPGPSCKPQSKFKVHDYLRAVHNGEHHPIPRLEWYKIATLRNSVSIVDIHARNGDIVTERQGWYNDCWCGNHPGLPDSPEVFGSSFRNLRFLRCWGPRAYTLSGHFTASREVLFIEPGSGDWERVSPHTSCPVLTLHLGCLGTETQVHFPYEHTPLNAHPKATPHFKLFIRFTPMAGPSRNTYNWMERWERLGIAVFNILSNHGTVTLVEPRSWAHLQEAIETAHHEIGGDSTDALKHAWSSLWDQFISMKGEPEERERLSRAVKKDVTVVSEKEYRKSVGEEVYSLEEFNV